MPHLPKIHKQRIVLVAGVLLISVTVLVGLSVFLYMKQQAEALMSKSLQLALLDRVQLIHAEISANLDKATSATTHRLLTDRMQEQGSQNLLSTGVTAIALMDKNGRELARAGTFVRKPELAVSLHFPGSTVQLMWNGRLVLHSIQDMKKEGHVIGKVIAETLLPESSLAFRNVNRLGETGDLMLCAPFDVHMKCFPTTLNPRVMDLPQRNMQGVPFLMTRAMEGGTGFMLDKDYRNQMVAAAYAPVGDSGLGLVLKMDSTELNAPLWKQLRYLIPILAGILGIALLLLHWLLGPLVIRLVRSEEKAAQRAVALTQKITTHRQVEAELLSFKNVLDNTLDMIFMVLPNTFRFVYLNQGAVLHMGYTREELLELTCCDIAPTLSGSNTKTKFRRGIASLLAGEQASLQFDSMCRRKDGTNFPVDIFLQMMSQSDGNHLLVAIVRDISERKKIDQMKSDFISVMYKRNSEAVTVADSNGTILSVNPAFTKITGYSQEEVIGRNSSVLSSGHHDQPFYEAMWREINSVGHWGGEIWNRRKNGEVYLQWTTINAIFHDDGSIYRYVGLFSDISQKRQAKIERDALRHASQMKSEFLANMSHELRTPLNAIIGFSEAFKEGLLGDLNEEQYKYIGHVFDSGKYLLSLINDILDLSKVEAGKMVLDMEPVDIAALLESSLLIIKEKALAHHIGLELKVESEIGQMRADTRKLKQIVYNLLSNAVKFSNENGKVSLHARRVPRADVAKLDGLLPGRCFPLAANEFTEFLEICVIDNGIGISRAGMEKLFQPFSQIDSGLARKFEGTGLGLVMIKNLTELHGGTLALESDDNQGSRFTVWMPFRSVQDDLDFVPSVLAEVDLLETDSVSPTTQHEKAY